MLKCVMRNLIITSILALSLSGCYQSASPQQSQKKSDTASCKTCTFEPKLSLAPAFISTLEPQTAAFTLDAIQTYITSNPISGATWSYGTNEIWVSNSSKSIYAVIDAYGFLDTLTVNGNSFKFTYTIDGFVSAINKVINGNPEPYLSYVYDSSGTIPIGYVDLENEQYHSFDDESAQAYQPKETNQLSSSNWKNIGTQKFDMKAIQSSACDGCYTQFDIDMREARNACGLCTSLALAGLLACELLSAGIGTPICFATWVIANAACIGTYLIAEDTNNATLSNCLTSNDCVPPLNFEGYPKLRQPKGGR